MGLSPLKMMKNMKWTYVFSFAVSFFAFCAIKFFGFGYLGQLIVAFFAAVLYLVLILTKKSERTVFFKMAGYFGVKGRKAEDEKR